MLRRKNVYDGMEEFYVVVKEKGTREHELSQEEIKKKSEGVGGRDHQSMIDQFEICFSFLTSIMIENQAAYVQTCLMMGVDLSI